MQSSAHLAKQLFSMTWPMLFGILSIMSFQLVDSAFIGQLGVLPLAAQGFTAPIAMIFIGLQVGLGIATTSLIARALGASETRFAKQLGGLVVVLGAAGIFIVSLFVWFFRDAVLAMLSAPESVSPIIDVYWGWWLFSTWLGAMIYFFYSICRSNGNTMLPGIVMVVTSLLNIALDPVFIFVLDMGIVGAAIATIVSFTIGILIIVPKCLSSHWLTFEFDDLHITQTLAKIGHIMGPAMVSQLLPPLSSVLATKLLAGFGTAAVAAWAVSSRFEFFAIVTVLALTMTLPPMVGRFYGAGKFEEIKKVIRIAVVYVLAFQTLVALLVWFTASGIAGLMSSDEQVIEIVTWHLYWVPISLGPLGICMMMVSASNALGEPYKALWMSALRLFAFFLPCLWIGGQIGGLWGLFIGATLANVFAGITAWWIYQSMFKTACEAKAA
ncbi:Multidrug export protein MepA [Marinomonas gallaica]|uniref:Multidrug export protein MepA n=1 Tax=Marinomonas gallaica TaxID=1806667 RepID=A0A1C3JLJ5_9GAMM|nr:MATE family efflux transporter [Marinomonas gallaica]SBT16026.1 Multidrug export protein MepA [Marinomonas gallaica]SBT21074.1 Multidrug export protein MepA [Marinomonas gallaica]